MSDQPPPVEVPMDSLSDETLASVIEHFILREGTDYGAIEVSLESKIKQVWRQIERGDVKIVFDTENDSVTLMTEREFKKTSLS